MPSQQQAMTNNLFVCFFFVTNDIHDLVTNGARYVVTNDERRWEDLSFEAFFFIGDSRKEVIARETR